METPDDLVILTLKGSAALDIDPMRMLVVCAWCKLVLHWDYGQGVSHGICEDCSRGFVVDVEGLSNMPKEPGTFGRDDVPA